MANEPSAGRWWENYLVRYFMPSIAGVAIIAWLSVVAGPDFRQILFFGKEPSPLNAPTLTLLVLYGNLFCYVASYPILCFHSTRVTDFENYRWKPRLTDGYVATVILAIAVLVVVLLIPTISYTRIVMLFMLVIWFSGIQLIRFRHALGTPSISGYSKYPTSLAYAYLITLSKRRGIVSERTTIATPHQPNELGDEDSGSGGSVGESITEEQELRWQKEFLDSYRHMREHGNSAFIFILEMILATVCYGIVALWPADGVKTLSLIAFIFVIWSFPAMFVHMVGQHLERRFSIFDRKLGGDKPNC